jgi:hypothetical protein
MTTYETPGPVRLHLVLASGEIDVRTADVTQTTVEVEVLRGDPGAAAEVLQDVTPSADGGHRVRVEAPTRYRLFGRDPSYRFSLVVPNGAHVDARTASGDIAAAGLYGGVEVKTASGGVRIERAGGHVVASTVSGSIVIDATGGDAEVRTVSGAIRLGSVAGSLRLRGVSGRIEVEEARGSVTAKTVSGEVDVRCLGAGRTRVDSVSGNVSLGVEPGLHVWMDVSSVSGRTTSELAPDDEGAAAHRHAPATLDLTVSTVSGDVRITKPSIAAPAASQAS